MNASDLSDGLNQVIFNAKTAAEKYVLFSVNFGNIILVFVWFVNCFIAVF